VRKRKINIPKRNIETWIHHLRGVSVDEETSYPKLSEPGACKTDVKRFAAQKIRALAPDSLKLALAEMERLL
jgi:hypothetical protein